MAGKIRFAKDADDDLESIAAFSAERFGEAQAAKFEGGLQSAFGLISMFPLIGSDQSDIKPGARRHVHASHAIYYMLRDEEIWILRVLGPGQDPVTQFDEP